MDCVIHEIHCCSLDLNNSSASRSCCSYLDIVIHKNIAGLLRAVLLHTKATVGNNLLDLPVRDVTRGVGTWTRPGTARGPSVGAHLGIASSFGHLEAASVQRLQGKEMSVKR